MLTVTQVKKEPGLLPQIWLALKFSLSVPYNLLEIHSLEKERKEKNPTIAFWGWGDHFQLYR